MSEDKWPFADCSPQLDLNLPCDQLFKPIAPEWLEAMTRCLEKIRHSAV